MLDPADGPAPAVDGDRLTELYPYPGNLEKCWVRANMITSLDGGATADGRSGGLAGPGDRALFKLLRVTADVILMGAGTVRIENYSGVQLSAAQRQARQRRGQAEVPPIAIVTQSGDLDPESKVFTRTDVPPLVLTCTDSLVATRRRLGSAAEVIDASGPNPDWVDAATALRILADRDMPRVLTEGGPQLLGELIEDGLLDELCVTVAPILVGGMARRIVTGRGEVLNRMRRAHLLSDHEGYLYARYVRSTG